MQPSSTSFSDKATWTRWSGLFLRIAGFGSAFYTIIFGAAVACSSIAHAWQSQLLLRISWDILGVGTASIFYPVLAFSHEPTKGWMLVVPVLFWGTIMEVAYRILWPKQGEPHAAAGALVEHVSQLAHTRRLRRVTLSLVASAFVVGIGILVVRESRKPLYLPSTFQPSSFRFEHVERTPGAPLLGTFEFSYPDLNVPRTFPGILALSGQEFVPSAVEYEIRSGSKWQPVGPELKGLSGPAFALTPGVTYKTKIDLSPLAPFTGALARISIRSKDATRFVSSPFRVPKLDFGQIR